MANGKTYCDNCGFFVLVPVKRLSLFLCELCDMALKDEYKNDTQN
jgi:hypothetical protein